MLTKRIIPCLDVKDGRVVKGVNFVSLRDAGDPVECAKEYNLSGADELVFLDITATLEARDTVIDMVERVANEVFIPFTVGGGIRTVEDIRAILNAGADKVSLNSAAVKDPSFVKKASEMFGAQCIVVAIDVKRREGQEDKFPSGWEIQNDRLYSSSVKYPAGVTYQDFRDDRVYSFFNLSAGSSVTIDVKLIASYPGHFYLPAVSCTAMYDDTVSALVPGQWIDVK